MEIPMATRISETDPTINPGFSVIHSNHLEDLRDIAVEWIRSHPLQPLENEHFIVQSNGMGQWIKMALASDDGCGISAALTVELPGNFMWQAYRAVLGDGEIPKNSPYDKSRLVWRLLRMLPQLLSESAGADSESADHLLPIKRFLEGGDSRKSYQLACQLASLFDQYQVYRAEWLLAWSSGENLIINGRNEKIHLPDGQIWQAQLWRKIRSDISEEQRYQSRADLHKRFLSATEKLSQRPKGLPRRVILFGICSLPRAVIETLHTISRFCQVLLFVHNPCRHYWADIVEERKGSVSESVTTQFLSYTDHTQGDASLFNQPVNPLLAAWGKQGRDYIGMLLNFEHSLNGFAQTELFRDVVPQGEAGTLLQQVQQAILDLRHTPDIPVISSDDQSITFHLCHSPQREVEILQDQLLSYFESIPGLAPRDIIVMTPDIESYAPHIAAVFGNISRGDPRYIPFTIADKPEQESMPLLLGLEKLLSLPDSRMAVGDLMELLQIPAFRHRFGLSESDIPKLNQWIEGSGIRWGLNPEHRSALDLLTDQSQQQEILEEGRGRIIWEQNTWRFGLQRMMVGYASGRGEALKNIEPYDEVGGLEASLAGILFSIIELMEKHWRELTLKALPEVWSIRLRGLIRDFFLPEQSSDRLWVTHMDEVIDQWLQSCNDADLQEELTLTVVRDYLLSAMTESTISHRFLAGMVNFGTLMPMRAIPFKVVCLLGMNDGAYPRSRPPLDFDLMSMPGFYRPGDRSRREDDRYLFLEALLSAREKFYISYTFRSVRDNSERVPSVLVGQLRDYIESGWKISDIERSRIKSGGESEIEYLRDSDIQDRDNLSETHSSEEVQQREVSVLKSITTHHPLQPFSRSYFQTDPENRLFTYAHEWRKILDPQSIEPYSSLVGVQYQQPPASSMLRTAQFEGAMKLQSLISFMKNPVKSFFNQRLKVYFDEINITSEEVEPFDLERLATFGPGVQMVESGVAAQPDQRIEAVENVAHQLLRTGQMPVNAFGRIAVDRLADSVYRMVEFHDRLTLEWPSESEALEIELPVSLEGCGISSLDDLIDRVRQKEIQVEKTPICENGALSAKLPLGSKSALPDRESLFARWEFYPGPISDDQGRVTRPDTLIPLWIRHLAGCSIGIDLTSYLIATDGVAIFSSLDSLSAKSFMNKIMEHWWQAMRYPLPVTAKSAMGYLKGLDLTDSTQLNRDIPEALRQSGEKSARKAYEGDGYISGGEVGYCRYLQRTFPDFDSLWQAEDNRFVELALTLYLPIVKHVGAIYMKL